MMLLFQFDILAKFGLPFQTGSHFLVFQCPPHRRLSE
jgi:hypothetical protein